MSNRPSSDRSKRTPLRPVSEGWRRYALFGAFVIAAFGVLATLGAVHLLPWLVAHLR